MIYVLWRKIVIWSWPFFKCFLEFEETRGQHTTTLNECYHKLSVVTGPPHMYTREEVGQGNITDYLFRHTKSVPKGYGILCVTPWHDNSYSFLTITRAKDKTNTHCFPRLLDGGSRVLPKGLLRPPDEGLIPSDGLLRLKWTPGLNGMAATTSGLLISNGPGRFFNSPEAADEASETSMLGPVMSVLVLPLLSVLIDEANLRALAFMADTDWPANCWIELKKLIITSVFLQAKEIFRWHTQVNACSTQWH